ncbi:MAG: DUF72 domain-containing protein [Candidatus Heimdallarchaeota archaeon]|nr:DUF72 domain-containing protein [Candidatus Heimdallarchaeota archaeon]
MIYLGISGWDYQHLTRYFPENSNLLHHYSSKLKIIEIERSFFETPSKKLIEDWYNSTPDSFTFIARMHKDITFNPNNYDSEKLKNHIETLVLLKEKVQHIVFNFSRKFQKSEKNVEAILTLLNETKKMFPGNLLLDLPNHSWNKEDKEFKHKLQALSASLINTEKQILHHSMRDEDLFYLRLCGDRILVSAKEFGSTVIDRSRDIRYWTTFIKSLNKKHRFIYIIIDHHFSGDALEDVRLFAQSLKLKNLMNIFEDTLTSK